MARETAIRGIVRRRAQPVQGAYVRLKGASGEFVGEVRSDERGRFTLYAAPGEWTLSCLVPDPGQAVRKEQPVSLRAGEEKDLEVEL